MRLFFRFLVLSLLVVGASQVSAEERNRRVSREQLAERQAKRIAYELAMSQEVTARFVEVYCNCQREIWALGPRVKPTHEWTEAEADSMIRARMERSEQLLQIRKRYHDVYRTFLTAKQMERVYHLERQMINQLSNKTRQTHHNKKR